jgi:hypothetical protein
MPIATPVPTSITMVPPDPRPPTIANTAKVPARTRPAEVTVVPVRLRARATAARTGKSRVSSLILVMTRML